MFAIFYYYNAEEIYYIDLKPENIMVDAKGNMFMIDMGTAKDI